MFRSIQSFIIAIFVTLGLIFGMYALIKQDEPELGERNSTKLPDFVHVLSDGKIVKSGDKDLALKLENEGYGWIEGVNEARGAA